ncbi:MAG: bifunctional adenosylcobinamide kinase/adenosylcobinamide-phosphate guanylyltransferase [Firmicutes bacterium]|nr:bifunctional adenosylcobinamide kinase/adenosylcobinamide-phosphate guanylyltransferase [Bacillota bacterium]
MILVFGGAYQGKLDYALETFGVAESDVYRCSRDGELDLTKKVIYGFEEFVYWCTENEVEAREVLAGRFDPDAENPYSGKILIASDVSQGLVPMDATDRAFREMMGRTLLHLAKEADEVHRVFCGIGQRLK